MIANYEKSEEEKAGVVRMFCTYCRRSLINAKTDIIRKQARRARQERFFCDMRESELNRLSSPANIPPFEAVFNVYGLVVTVSDPDIADAIQTLDADGRAVVLLHYFAEWSDRKIGTHLGLPRSTVQFRRTNALRFLRILLGGGDSDDL